MQRFQQIQLEAQMGMEKPLLKKRGFAGRLDADEDDGLHKTSAMCAKQLNALVRV